MMTTNRTLEEKQLAYKIHDLKTNQYSLRRKWLELDIKINNLKNKLNEHTKNRMNKRRKPKKGDFYNDRT